MKNDRRREGSPGRRGAKSVEDVISARRAKLATRRSLGALICKIVATAAAVYLIFSYVFGLGIVSGEGMYPRMRDGDLAVYYRLDPGENIGDVVTFEVGGERQYARIVARGGDTVDMSDDGLLIVNGNVQQEDIFFATSKEGRSTQFPYTVGTDAVFVLSDNRTGALDSRDYGEVKTADIDGKVISLLRRRGL